VTEFGGGCLSDGNASQPKLKLVVMRGVIAERTRNPEKITSQKGNFLFYCCCCMIRSRCISCISCNSCNSSLIPQSSSCLTLPVLFNTQTCSSENACPPPPPPHSDTNLDFERTSKSHRCCLSHDFLEVKDDDNDTHRLNSFAISHIHISENIPQNLTASSNISTKGSPSNWIDAAPFFPSYLEYEVYSHLPSLPHHIHYQLNL